jgi:hypothetical protein
LLAKIFLPPSADLVASKFPDVAILPGPKRLQSAGSKKVMSIGIMQFASLLATRRTFFVVSFIPICGNEFPLQCQLKQKIKTPDGPAFLSPTPTYLQRYSDFEF